MARRAKAVVQDIDAISTDVIERFDAVNWSRFNTSDLAERNEIRSQVLDVREDLMKVATVDPARAAQIWDEHVPTYVPRPPELPAKEPEPLTLNTIEPGRTRRRPGAEPFLDQSEAINIPLQTSERPGPARAENGRASQSQAKDHVADDPNAERVRILLEGLNRQYLKAEDKYHFRDRGGEVAFEAQEKKLVTQHETPLVVTSMIDLAEARGWSSLKLAGTKDFRREAWLQASLRDFEVSGYQPNKADKAKLEEIRTERRGDAPENTISPDPTRANGPKAPDLRFDGVTEDGKAEPRLSLTAAQDQFLRVMEATMRHRGDAPEAIERARALANERLTAERIHVGTVVEVGHAPYQERRGEKVTPFVTLRDDQGQVSKVWGVDLPRALEASRAQPGEKVAVVFKGRKPVEVDVPIRNQKGETVRTERKVVDRNTWEVVAFDRLRDEAKTSVAKAVDRQNNPAALRVFDQSAPPARLPTPDRSKVQPRDRPRERVV